MALLGELVEIISGFAFKSDQFAEDGGLPLVRIRDVKRGYSETRYVGDYEGKYLIGNGDLLVGMDGEFNAERWAGGKALLNQRVCKIVATSPELCEQYLYYFLPKQLKLIEDATPSVTVKHLSAKTIKNIDIPLLPLEEQKRIAAILDKADAIRRKRQQSIDLADQLLRSVFLDMFGDPVTNPNGWDVCLLGDVVENCDSKRIPVKQADRDLRHGEYPYYGSVGVIDYIDDYLFEGEHLLISEDGKHLESRNRPIACIANSKFWVNNHAHVLKFNGKADLQYLARLFEMISIRKYVTGIDQFKLNRKSLDAIPVPVPPINLQLKFREFLEKSQVQKQKMESHFSESENLLGALTQKAFRHELGKQNKAA